MKKEIYFPKGAESISVDMPNGVITAVYEEEKPVLKVGEFWYHSTGGLNLILEVPEDDFGTVKCMPIYGENASFHGIKTMTRKADMKEVKKLLIKEAKKRGYKDQIDVIPLGDKMQYTCNSDEFTINEKFGLRVGYPIIFSFKTGKWAEIVEDKKEFKQGYILFCDGYIFRLKETTTDIVVSGQSFFYDALHPSGDFYITTDWFYTRESRIATLEERIKFIEAEHANGYCWNGIELIKIPEYVEITKINSRTWQDGLIQGHIFPVNCVNNLGYWNVGRGKLIPFDNSKPSTKEAYDKQHKYYNTEYSRLNQHEQDKKELYEDSIEYKYEKLTEANNRLEESVQVLENLAQSQADEIIELIKEKQRFEKSIDGFYNILSAKLKKFKSIIQ